VASTEKREELGRLFKLHRSIPFPPSHTDEEIQAVHDHLIVYDAEIAGLVSRILEGEESARDLLKENSWLRRQIERLLAEKPDAADLLRRYLEESDRLSQMIALAKRIS